MTAPIRFNDVLDGGPDDVPLVPNFRAAIAVVCPKCMAVGGQSCQSTGGGNGGSVVTHQARIDRISGLTSRVQDVAADKVRALGLNWWGRSAEFAEFEVLAAPIVTKSKTLTPKGVRLSEKQAEEIEGYVMRGGYGSVSTAHFHGDAQHRQTVNALEAKGILAEYEPSDGYSRGMKLTEFGWQVYDQHRLIIKRLTDEQVAEQRARAESGRCLECGKTPGDTKGCDLCDLERFTIADRARRASAA